MSSNTRISSQPPQWMLDQLERCCGKAAKPPEPRPAITGIEREERELKEIDGYLSRLDLDVAPPVTR